MKNLNIPSELKPQDFLYQSVTELCEPSAFLILSGVCEALKHQKTVKKKKKNAHCVVFVSPPVQESTMFH